MNAFSKCANPECTHLFQAGEGRFFRFLQNIPDGEISNAHGVRHYWLCDRCSESLTLRYREDVGIVVADRLHPPASLRNVAA